MALSTSEDTVVLIVRLLPLAVVSVVIENAYKG